MQQFSFDIIGTHLDLRIDTIEDCVLVFMEIEARLRDFESKYSRFIEGNWLDTLNKNKTGTLDTDGRKMLEFILDISRQTDGYFDPTVGKRLSEL